ncbi:uncharacterized protein LOC135104955 [Scylla paramamosain]|uniref:uncharacterized protein LOC135104955 n=1 Tax=Scylla paramamosain TaxID=85552 RepID=UPI003083920C
MAHKHSLNKDCQALWKDQSLPPAVVLELSNPLLLVEIIQITDDDIQCLLNSDAALQVPSSSQPAAALQPVAAPQPTVANQPAAAPQPPAAPQPSPSPAVQQSCSQRHTSPSSAQSLSLCFKCWKSSSRLGSVWTSW